MKPIHVHDELFMDRLTLRFSQAVAEQDFRSEFFQRSIKPLRYLFGSGMVVYTGQAVRDLIYLQPWTFFVEYMMVVPMLLIVFALTYLPSGGKWIRIGIVLTIALISSSNVLVTALNPDPPEYMIAAFVTLTFCVYTVAQLLIPFSATACLLVFLLFLWAVVFVFDMSVQQVWYVAMPLMVANVVGLLAGYTIEVHRRKEFAGRHQLLRVNRELDEVNRLKNEFLGIVAHDLRNPLQTIIGYSDMLREDSHLSEEQERAVDAIGTAGYRMNRILAQLMDIIAIETGTVLMKMGLTDWAALTKEICQDYAKTAARKSQRICTSLAPDAWVEADETKLRSVVDNLVSNALKYSPQGEAIDVQLVADTSVARLTVSDRGPGFADDDFPKLFQRFQKLRAKPTGGESSVGLGLSIAKRFVDLHSGRIRAENGPDGTGARFIVELPLVSATT